MVCSPAHEGAFLRRTSRGRQARVNQGQLVYSCRGPWTPAEPGGLDTLLNLASDFVKQASVAFSELLLIDE